MIISSCVMGIECDGNRTNFIASEKNCYKIFQLETNRLSETLVKKRIQFKLNPLSAPHHGGVWERFVGSFKNLFYAILGNRRLTEEILLTTFCVVEQSLNAHTLVPVSSVGTDLDALTPSNFLWEPCVSLCYPANEPSLTTLSATSVLRNTLMLFGNAG